MLDDSDIYSAIKAWCDHPDKTLSVISRNLIDRKLPKIAIQKLPFENERIEKLKEMVKEKYQISEVEIGHLVFDSEIANNAYNAKKDIILIKYKNGSVLNITDASDNFNIQALTESVKKYFICYPKEFRNKW